MLYTKSHKVTEKKHTCQNNLRYFSFLSQNIGKAQGCFGSTGVLQKHKSVFSSVIRFRYANHTQEGEGTVLFAT